MTSASAVLRWGGATAEGPDATVLV